MEADRGNGEVFDIDPKYLLKLKTYVPSASAGHAWSFWNKY